MVQEIPIRNNIRYIRARWNERSQAKAGVIAGASCIVSEINPHAANKRHEQGWLSEIADSTDDAIDRMLAAKSEGRATSIGHIGNIVELLERMVEEK